MPKGHTIKTPTVCITCGDKFMGSRGRKECDTCLTYRGRYKKGREHSVKFGHYGVTE